MKCFLQWIATLLVLVPVVSSSNIGKSRQDINIGSDGGYTDILVAIDERVPENQDIVKNLEVGEINNFRVYKLK